MSRKPTDLNKIFLPQHKNSDIFKMCTSFKIVAYSIKSNQTITGL